MSADVCSAGVDVRPQTQRQSIARRLATAQLRGSDIDCHEHTATPVYTAVSPVRVFDAEVASGMTGAPQQDVPSPMMMGQRKSLNAEAICYMRRRSRQAICFIVLAQKRAMLVNDVSAYCTSCKYSYTAAIKPSGVMQSLY